VNATERSAGLVQVDIGVHTADAEDVQVHFSSGELVLSFVDWQEQPRRKVFADVLAFRWQEFDEESIRDDVVYEVERSDWLARQARLQGVPGDDYVHYKLCFNACGMLDVLCRRTKGPA
jgi:hypothetical protein